MRVAGRPIVGRTRRTQLSASRSHSNSFGAATMRSVQYFRHGGPDVLEMLDIPPPDVKAGEFLIDVHAVSVNPVDAKIRAGRVGQLPPSFPAPTGRDGAGVVKAAGDGADAGLVGSRICFLAPRGTGTWTDIVSMPVE